MSDYKLVPVEPTPEMIDAGRSQSSFPLGVYKAMLAAAPAVQGEPVAWMTCARVFGEGFTTDRRQAEKWMKSYPSKTTSLYTAPQPAEQQPDAAWLVELRELLLIFRGKVGGALWSLDDEDKTLAVRVEKAIAALAAYRKGGNV